MKNKNIYWLFDVLLDQKSLNICLNQIFRQQSNGYKVYVLICGEDPGSCFINTNHSKNICKLCNKTLIATLRFYNIDFYNLKDYQNKYKINIPENIYLGPLSTFCSKLRYESTTHKIKLVEKYLKNVLFLLNKTSINIFKKLNNFHQNIDTNCEYWTFNGRTNISRALFEFCKIKNIDFYCMEDRGEGKHFITKNNLHFSPKVFRENFIFFLKNHPDKKKLLQKGKTFFYNKLNGIETYSLFNFAKISNSLPKNYIDNDILIVLSSGDEQSMLKDIFVKFYNDQLDVVSHIKKKYPSKKISIRFHPNQKNLNISDLKKYYQLLRNLDIEFYKPDHKVSTYELLFKSKLVITFGSTVSIEAAYHGIPTISCGTSFFSNCKLLTTVNSLSELDFYIQNPNKITNKKFLPIFFGAFLNDFSSSTPFKSFNDFQYTNIGIQKKFFVYFSLFFQKLSLSLIKKI